MPFKICKTFEIESGHMLSKHTGKCRFPHGHSRKVEIVLMADTLDDNEMVCDFTVIKEAIASFLETLDHSMCVNSKDPQCEHLKSQYGDRVVVFPNMDPTTEVLAKLIFDRCRESLVTYKGKYKLRNTTKVSSVRVWETSSSWAEYLP